MVEVFVEQFSDGLEMGFLDKNETLALGACFLRVGYVLNSWE